MALIFEYEASKRKGIIKGKDLEQIRDHFSVTNPAATFAKRSSRFIPNRKYCITATGRFDVGILHEILGYCLSTGIPEPLISKELSAAFSPGFSGIKSDELYGKLGLVLRPYQIDACKAAIRVGRGIIEVGTAGGKSLIASEIISTLYTHNTNLSVLFIVPDRGLVNQMYGDFQSYGVPFTYSKWTGDDALNLFTNVVICNMGILNSKSSNTDWTKGVDVVIVDEAHGLRKGNQICKLVDQTRTLNRIGFTGTLPEDKIDQWNIKGLIGPVIYRKKAHELRDDKYVAPVKAQILEIQYTDTLKYVPNMSPRWNYDKEIDFLVENKFRNDLIASLAKNLQKNSLILVDFIKHGDTLKKVLTAACSNKRVYWIHGEVDVDERDRIKRIMEKHDNVVCIAISKIFSTGISINNLHYLVFAGGGKSKIKTLQSIGRTMRLHKSKENVYIIDIADQTRYGSAHLQKRIGFYDKEKIVYARKTIKEK